MNIEKLKELFKDIASQYETYEEIIEDIRGLNSAEEISDDDYDCILEHWDEWINELD